MTTHLTKIWYDLRNSELVKKEIPEAEIYKREWQGLTDEEIEQAWALMNHDPAAFVHFAGGALIAEQILKEKNND